jgi:hypothetical protein
MPRLAHIACAATVFVAAGSLTAHADPINISVVSGSVVINRGPGNGTLDLAGTHGFTLTATAGVLPEAGLQGPFAQCLVPACTPGSPIGLDISFTGQSNLLGGIVLTADGNTYDDFEGALSTGNLELAFSGSVVAPAFTMAQTSVTAPFSLTGIATAPGLDASLHGSGIATLTLVPFGPAGEGSWSANELRFDFSPQPTPEPSTMLLLGSGALTLFRRRRES